MTSLGRSMTAMICLFAAMDVFAEETAKPKSNEYIISIPQFDDISIEEGDKAANAALDAYNKSIKNLLEQLREGKTNNQKTLTIYLLGSLRAKSAVHDLVKIIDFRADRVDPKTRIGRWSPYPAQDALSKIGNSAVPPILSALGKEDNELRRKLMVMVISDCFGDDVGIYVIKKWADSTTDARIKSRYEKAIEIISNWKN
jgi:hypothetical protein